MGTRGRSVYATGHAVGSVVPRRRLLGVGPSEERCAACGSSHVAAHCWRSRHHGGPVCWRSRHRNTSFRDSRQRQPVDRAARGDRYIYSSRHWWIHFCGHLPGRGEAEHEETVSSPQADPDHAKLEPCPCYHVFCTSTSGAQALSLVRSASPPTSSPLRQVALLVPCKAGRTVCTVNTRTQPCKRRATSPNGFGGDISHGCPMQHAHGRVGKAFAWDGEW